MQRARRVLTLIAALSIAAGACRGGKAAPPLPITIDKGRFPHALHTALSCIDCHALEQVLAGVPARPGGQDHAPCDRARCHLAEFSRPPGDLCKICHETVSIGQPGTTEAAYTPRTGRRALASEFSHARHLDLGAMEDAVGFHVSCSDCHTDQAGQLRQPDHATCARCHAPEAAPDGAPQLHTCGQCHRERASPPLRIRRLIVGDLRFDHVNHRLDRRAAPIGCTVCHTRTSQVDNTGEHEPPRTRDCVDCHDNANRTPVTYSMRECETCHTERTSNIGTLPPRSHLPATERPADHTLAFRADHARDVDRDAARCAKCHTFLSGSDHDTCDECHQVMEPRSHTVTWREYDHGPEAAARSDGCAICHGGDFCIACHQVAPRSHQPLGEFSGPGHAPQAKLNPRSCITCHRPEMFCVNCHAPGALRR